MDNDKQALMDLHGITCSTKTQYHYQIYTYSNLKDAITYSKLDAKRHAKTEGAVKAAEAKLPSQPI